MKKSYSNTPLPAVVIGYKIPARYAPDAYPLDLASNILAGGESSRLYQTLVYKEQIAVQAAGFGAFSEDPNLFWAYAIMNQGHTAEEGEKSLRGVLDGLKAQPPEAKELEKAKNQEIAGYVLGRDTDEEKAVALASAAVIGKDPGLANTELDHYFTASAADIQRVAKDYFQSAHATVLIVTPAAPGAHRSTRATMTPRSKRKTFSGATMKRDSRSRSLFLIAATMFSAAIATLPPIAACAATRLRAGIAQRNRTRLVTGTAESLRDRAARRETFAANACPGRAADI